MLRGDVLQHAVVQPGVQRVPGLRVDRLQAERDGGRRRVAGVMAAADVVSARAKVLDLRSTFRVQRVRRTSIAACLRVRCVERRGGVCDPPSPSTGAPSAASRALIAVVMRPPERRRRRGCSRNEVVRYPSIGSALPATAIRYAGAASSTIRRVVSCKAARRDAHVKRRADVEPHRQAVELRHHHVFETGAPQLVRGSEDLRADEAGHVVDDRPRAGRAWMCRATP